MKKIILTFFFIPIFLYMSELHAFSVFIEPSLGVHLGNYRSETVDVSGRGLGIDGKMGMGDGFFMGGLEIEFSSYTLNNLTDDNWQNRQFGVFAGVDLRKQVPFKMWFTFYPHEELHSGSIEQLGLGYKFGLGFYPILFDPIGFVFEYRSSSYDEIDDGITKRDLAIKTDLDALYFGMTFLFDETF
jgi:hypothetical protein